MSQKSRVQVLFCHLDFNTLSVHALLHNGPMALSAGSSQRKWWKTDLYKLVVNGRKTGKLCRVLCNGGLCPAQHQKVEKKFPGCILHITRANCVHNRFWRNENTQYCRLHTLQAAPIHCLWGFCVTSPETERNSHQLEPLEWTSAVTETDSGNQYLCQDGRHTRQIQYVPGILGSGAPGHRHMNVVVT